MKLRFAFLGLLSLIAVSCSYEESFVPEDNNDNSTVEFYATIDEQPDTDTKVYADENLKVLWNADDRITIFNKIAYNQEYRFTGVDGDNSGTFKKVPNDDFATGTELERIYAVYPYRESTRISNSGIITTAIPSEQTYLANSFGRGANTMVASAGDNLLRFKNVGGYLSLKFYGEGVSVSSITLKSNNGEFIAGDCTVDMSSGLPESNLLTTNVSDAITMVCDPPIELPAEKDDAVMAIFVLSPGTLTGGVTVTVTTVDGGVFEKSTSNKLEIGRSAITRLGALEVVPEYVGNIVFADPEVKRICVENWDTDGNGELSTEEAAAVTDLNQCFKNNTIIASFDELQYFTGLTILSADFWGCTNLTSVVLPETVKEIGVGAFAGCESLSSIEIPASVSSIYNNAFGGTGLTSITFPEGSSINFHEGAFVQCMSLSTVRFEGAISSYGVESGVFEGCPITDLYFGNEFNYLGIIGSPYYSPDNLYYQLFRYYGKDLLDICTIEVSDQNSKYDSRDNCNALIETATNSLILGCKNTTIPESVTCIASGSLTDIDPLTSFIVPAAITSIGGAFDPRLESITLESMTPPTLIDNGLFGFNWDNDDTPTIIYVPTESVEAYKAAEYWSDYADRIQAIPIQPDYASEPFTITSIGSTSIYIGKYGYVEDITLEYKKEAESWAAYTIGSIIDLADGETLQFRAGLDGNSNFSTGIQAYYTFYVSGSGGISVSGNIMSLLDRSLQRVSLNSYAFYGLFELCSGLRDASNLQLPATSLAELCYSDMFYGCSSLTSGPGLPATSLAYSCYQNMFAECTNLVNAPALPATSLASQCYTGMFRKCTKLTSAPTLPATELVDYCYADMFKQCTDLISAPDLPAPTLTKGCYEEMFYGCTSLNTAPELPAMSLIERCYYQMFYGCSSLNYVKALFSTTPSDSYTSSWLAGVAASGTFVMSKEATWNVTGNSGIPSGWTVLTE